jgi:hypothetical protein
VPIFIVLYHRAHVHLTCSSLGCCFTLSSLYLVSLCASLFSKRFAGSSLIVYARYVVAFLRRSKLEDARQRLAEVRFPAILLSLSFLSTLKVSRPFSLLPPFLIATCSLPVCRTQIWPSVPKLCIHSTKPLWASCRCSQSRSGVLGRTRSRFCP